MKTFQIKSTNGEVQFEHECNSLEEAIAEAIRQKTDLRWADLRWANLWWADLRGADLRGVSFQEANLRWANFRGADLRWANFQGANLRWANFQGANLRGANFQGANLRGVNFWGADFDKKQLDNFYQKNCIVPDGKIIGWKKGESGYIIKLEIPEKARRMNVIGSRKCRAGYAKVLEIRNSKGHMQNRCMNNIHNNKIVYITGQMIYPDSYDPDPRKKCSHGIHFFITRIEAKDF